MRDMAGNISISEVARRMGTNRMAVHSLLDSTEPTMTIESASAAARSAPSSKRGCCHAASRCALTLNNWKTTTQSP